MERKGSLTVEAVLMVPFLILISMALIYFAIYVYDRTLINQDAESLVSYERAATGTESGYEEKFLSFKEEHPYLSIEGLSLSLEGSGTGGSLNITGEWKLPVLPAFDSTISCSKNLYRINPVKMMYVTDSAKELWEDILDDDPDDL